MRASQDVGLDIKPSEAQHPRVHAGEGDGVRSPLWRER